MLLKLLVHAVITYYFLGFLVITDVATNFAITVELSGRTKKQHVLAHFGPRTIFGLRIMIGTGMKKRKKRKMTIFMTLIIQMVFTK